MSAIAISLLQLLLVAPATGGRAGIERIGDDENVWQDGEAKTPKAADMTLGDLIFPLKLTWTSFALVVCLLLLIAVHAFLSWLSEMV